MLSWTHAHTHTQHTHTHTHTHNTLNTLQPEAIAMYKELGYEHVSVVSSSTPIVGRVLSFLTFETRL